MSHHLVQVDAFTDRPFAGNPAAVCLLETPVEDAWMQRVAQEMNLSETAFLVPRKKNDGFDLRWFTPAAEVELCGHATLASAHVLWQDGHLKDGETARFHTVSGLLTAELAGGWIEMDFPADPPEPVLPPEELEPALGTEPVWVGRGRFDYLLELESEDAVRALDPDLAVLGRIGARGYIATARASTAEVDIVSRCFYPAVGIAEDPVTGSAHCCLAPFWSAKLGKDTLTAHQASARGGDVKTRVDGDDRVILAGQAITTARIELLAG